MEYARLGATALITTHWAVLFCLRDIVNYENWNGGITAEELDMGTANKILDCILPSSKSLAVKRIVTGYHMLDLQNPVGRFAAGIPAILTHIRLSYRILMRNFTSRATCAKYRHMYCSVTLGPSE